MEEKEKKMTETPNLTDKRSVRTTFRIPRSGIDSIVWLSKNHQITQKETIDFILNISWLNEAVRTKEFPKDKLHISASEKLVRKTYVISKGALKKLNTMSKELSTDDKKISRDDLLAFYAGGAKIMVETVIENRKKNYQKAFDSINNFWQDASNLESQLTELLGDVDEDPIVNRFFDIVTRIGALVGEIESNIENGETIEFGW